MFEFYCFITLFKTEIDGRLFFTSQSSKQKINPPLTPMKFHTPFPKQGISNKFGNDLFQKNLPNSHRILKYDDKQDILPTKKPEAQIVQKSCMFSPFVARTNFNSHLISTPMTNALQMYDWLKQQITIIKNPNHDSSLNVRTCYIKNIKYQSLKINNILQQWPELNNEQAFEMYKQKLLELIGQYFIKQLFSLGKILNQTKIKEQTQLEKKEKQILYLYFRSLQSMLEEQKLQNFQSENFSLEKSLLCCCVETIFFIYNNNDISLEKLLECCECSAFDLAKIIVPFMHYTNDIPNQLPVTLKKHFTFIERELMLYLIWKENNKIEQLLQKQNLAFIKNNSEDCSSFGQTYNQEKELTLPEQKFIDHFFQHIYSFIEQLGESLKLSKSYQNTIKNLIEYIIKYQLNLLNNRHMDVLIICSFFAVCKNTQSELSFRNIISNYQTLPLSHKILQDIVYQIDMNNEGKSNIKEFYNQLFLQNDDFKQYLITQKQNLDSQQNEKKKFVFSKKSNENEINFDKFQTPQLKKSQSFMTPRQMALKSFDEFESPINCVYQRKLKIKGLRQEQQVILSQMKKSQKKIKANAVAKSNQTATVIQETYLTKQKKEILHQIIQSNYLSKKIKVSHQQIHKVFFFAVLYSYKDQEFSQIQDFEENQFSNSQSGLSQFKSFGSPSDLEFVKKKIDKTENKSIAQFSIFKGLNNSQN